jgi:6-phosphogluconolactonase (cycloisomerase 2 family)
MKLSLFGRLTMALLASVALGLGMTACGGGTIGYMWVLGQQYNQIAGFKIDDFTGNLTTVPRSPFTTSGSVPVSIVVKSGGRFVYVINQGTSGSANGPGVGQSIVEFAVGGDGTLTYQATFQSQGYVSQWAQMDSSGTYLYVLDKYSPTITNGPTGPVYGPNTDGRGSVTVFSSDPNTGRLSLVTNSQTQVGNVNTYFYEVGTGPFMMKTAGSCLLTLDSDQTVFPYGIGSSGQLTVEQQGSQLITANGVAATSLTSINGNGSYVYLTDSDNLKDSGKIWPTTIGSNCTLTSVIGGSVPNLTGTLNPTYTLTDNSGKYLYVLNYSNTNTTTQVPNSNISAYTISPVNGQLQPIAGAPFTVGSGPVCMVEDTSNQYIYISNHYDGTITGKVIDPTTGNLSDLSRGATFTATGQASCLVLSGAVS